MMRRFLTSLVALALILAPLPAAPQTGSSKTSSVLNSEVNTCFVDLSATTAGAITPFCTRQTLLDVIASMFTQVNPTSATTLTVTSLTTLNGFLTLAGTPTSGTSTTGTLSNSLCLTSTSTVVYVAGANCYAATASSITAAVTTVAGATSGTVLNATNGLLGSYGVTGTGSVVMSANPTIVAPTFNGTIAGSPTFSGNPTFSGSPSFTGSVGTFTAGNTTLTGTLTAASLSTSGVIAGSLCATSAGLILFESAINCFSSSGLIVVSGKILSISNTMFIGAPSDGLSYTFPSATDTLLGANTQDQTVSGGANITALNLGTVSSGTKRIDCGQAPLQYLVNGGAFTLAAPTSDGECIVQVLNNSVAGNISFSGFSAGQTNTGDPYNTTSSNFFSISIWRVQNHAQYLISAGGGF